MCSFVGLFGLSELRLEFFGLLCFHTQLVHHTLHLLLGIAFLIHQLESVTLSVLNSLEELDLFLQISILTLRVNQLIFQISDSSMRSCQVAWAFTWGDPFADTSRAGWRFARYLLFELHDFLRQTSNLIILLIQQVVQSPVYLLLLLQLLRLIDPAALPS